MAVPERNARLVAMTAMSANLHESAWSSTMRSRKMLMMGSVLMALAVSQPIARAARPAPPPPIQLTDSGQKLEADYAGQLKTLQAEIEKLLPKLDEKRVAAFREASAATRKAEAAAAAAKKPLEAISQG
jgi:hypothetical protein